jgi:hypothetical protein
MAKTTSDLMEQRRKVGNQLDRATDPEVMRFLLRGRRAVTAALEAKRAEADRQLTRGRVLAPAPYRFTGMTDDGFACYDEM